MEYLLKKRVIKSNIGLGRLVHCYGNTNGGIDKSCARAKAILLCLV